MADSANPAMDGAKIPNAAPANLSDESKNVFTELFGGDQSQKNNTLINSVGEKQDKKGFSFFGEKPKTDALTLKGLAKDEPVKIGSAILNGVMLLFAVTILFFASQNVAKFSFFGVNPALRVQMLEEQVAKSNAEINVQKHLSAALLLTKYSSLADEYLYNSTQAASAYTSQNKKVEFTQKASVLQSELLPVLTDIKNYLGTSLSREDLAAANAVADDLSVKLNAKSGQVDGATLLQEIQDLNTAKNLLKDAKIRSLLATADLTQISNEQIEEIYSVFSSMNQSTIALLGTIESTRKNWSSYIAGLELLTKKVDPLFDTEFPANIRLESMKFNSDGSINISGQTSTNDTKNFTLVSNLIDTYEKSEYFKNVDGRDYSKSEGEETSYTGNFRISMELGTNQ